MRPGCRATPSEIIVHRHDGFVRHAAVRIRDQLGRYVDDARADMTLADVLKQEVLVRQRARKRVPAGALVCRSGPRRSLLEARRNVVVVKVDDTEMHATSYHRSSSQAVAKTLKQAESHRREIALSGKA
jgi:hypothetical protein